VAGGILFFSRNFFFFLSPTDLRDGSTDRTFRAEKVGYRCNFINWSKICGATPIKILGAKSSQNLVIFRLFSDLFAHFSKAVLVVNNLKRTFKLQTFLYQVVKNGLLDPPQIT